MASRPRPLLARCLSVAAVVLCLGTQLASLAHIALVSHVRCAEHGELVHGKPGSPAAPDSDDEHCTLAAFHESPFSFMNGDSWVWTPAVHALEPRALPPTPPPPSIAVVSYAPKHSPPV